MQDTKVKPLNKHFRYSLYINQKALLRFLDGRGYEVGCLKLNGVTLVSFMVNCYLDLERLNCIEFQNEKYLQMTTNFIIENLPMIGIGKSTIDGLIKNITAHELIETIELRRMRYIKVNPELIDLWDNRNFNMNVISYLEKYHKDFWESFKNDWQPLVGNEPFEGFVLWFRSQVDVKGIDYKDKSVIFPFLNKAIEKWHFKPSKKEN